MFKLINEIAFPFSVAAPGPVNQISNNQAEHGTATTNEVTNQGNCIIIV